MGRGKVQLKPIEKRSERMSVHRRRLSSLKARAYELSTLCDIPALIISFDSDGKVDTFPENKEDVNAILNKYRLVNSKVPEKLKQNSESVIQAQILKKQLELNLLKLDNENALKSLLDNATINHLDSVLVEVEKKILLKKNQHMQRSSDTNNLQLVTTEEESVQFDNVLCGDIALQPYDLSAEDYLNGREDVSVENYLHGGDDFSVKDSYARQNLSCESDFLGGEQFSVEHSHKKENFSALLEAENFSVKQSHGGENLQVLVGGENPSFEDVHDWQVEGSAQSNDSLSDEIARLLDECNTCRRLFCALADSDALLTCLTIPFRYGLQKWKHM